MRTLHVLGGLTIGGRARVVLDLATRARRDGLDHRIVLFDTPFRGRELDLDPGEVPVHFVPRQPGVDWRFARKLARVCVDLEVDTLHAHDDTAVVYGALARQWLRGTGTGLVGTFHSLPAHDTLGARRLTRWAARRAGTITAASRELGGRLVAQGWIDLFRTVWTGVDLDVFAPEGPTGGWRELLGIPPEKLVVGHVGRFDPWKRQLDLLTAAKHFRDETTRPEFLFVGRGPELGEFRARAKALPHVHHLTHVPDMPAFLRELDVFAHCATNEASPRVLLEAMACGRACIASAVGDVPDIARSGGSSCLELVPPLRFDLVAEEIERLRTDPLRVQLLGQRARRRAEDFHAEEGWRAYRRVYELARAA